MRSLYYTLEVDAFTEEVLCGEKFIKGSTNSDMKWEISRKRKESGITSGKDFYLFQCLKMKQITKTRSNPL